MNLAQRTVVADPELPPGVAEGRATMPGLLRHRAKTSPDRVALREKLRGVWRDCPRRSNIDPACRLKFDPGPVAAF